MTNTLQQTLAQALDTASGYFYITNTQGTILYSNNAIHNKTGYTPGEVIGKNPGRLWGGNMPNNFYQRLWERITIQKQSFSGLAKNRKKDTTLYDETLCIFPLFDHENSIHYFIGFEALLPNTQDTIQLHNDLAALPIVSHNDNKKFFETILHWIHGTQHITFESSLSTEQLLIETCITPTEKKYAPRRRDTLLIEQAQKDTRQFEHMYTLYQPTVLHYFLKRTNLNTQTAEDLTQETFTQAFSHLNTFISTNASYLTYLLRIAHNMLVNHFRKTIFLPFDERLSETLRDQHQSGDIIDHYNLQKALTRLTEQEQKIINLMYHEGYSIREIASLQKKSENAVKLQISRARKKLHTAIQR